MEIINSTVVNAVFFIIDAVLVALVWNRGISPLKKIQADIQEIFLKLKSISPEDYVRQFEDIDKIFRADAYLKNAWEEYRKTLVRSRDEDGNQTLYSAMDAASFFRHNEITKSINVAYWQNFGGIFTGVGIFGTFAGLTLGIAGIDLTSGDVTVLKEGIGALLSGISTAFLTSLVGILLALAYGGIYHFYNNKLRETIGEMSNLIEVMYPRQITEQWLADGFHESKEQTRALKNLSDDMANSLGQILDTQLSNGFEELCDKLDQQLRPTFEKLYEAIAALNEGGTTAIAHEFDKQLGTQLSAFANVLTNMQEVMKKNMQASQGMSQEIHGMMKQTMENIQHVMAQGTTEAMQKQKESADQMSRQMQALVDAMNDSSQKAMDHYTVASQNAQEQLSASVAQTKETTDSIMTNLRTMIASMESQFREMASGQENRMKSMSEQQQHLLDASAAAADQRARETTNLLQKTIEQQNFAFETSSQMIKDEVVEVGELLTKVREASGSIKNVIVPIREAASSLQDELQKVRTESREMHDEIGRQLEQLASNNRQSAAQMRDLLSAMDKASAESASAWKKYQESFDGISGEMENTTKLLTDQLSKYNEAMNRGLTSQLQSFDKSVTNATSALSGIADELHETMVELAKNQRR